MKTLRVLLVSLAWASTSLAVAEAAPDTLTLEEKAAGWRWLWDGETTEGWRGARTDAFPAKGWRIENGVLTVLASGGKGSGPGGDIVTRETFADFELSVDFKLTPGANSGIKYFVAENTSLGLEYQLLDDALHPDAKGGRNGNRTLGSVYDLYPASAAKQVRPIGEWNTARIVSRGPRVEHWLNGGKVVEYERFTEAFRRDVQESKYVTSPGFGEWKEGRILLQDHGDEVHFRNIKIRALDGRKAR